MKQIKLLFWIIVILLILPIFVLADVKVITLRNESLFSDASLRQANINTNFDYEDNLQSNQHPTGYIIRSEIQFNATNITRDCSKILEAYFFLQDYAGNAVYEDQIYEIFGNATGDPSKDTWNSNPSGSGNNISNGHLVNLTSVSIVSVSPNTIPKFNITNIWKNVLSGNYNNATFGIAPLNPTAADTQHVYYSSSAATGQRPLVNVTCITTSDTTSPIINSTLNISTIRINNVLNITANATDETGLSGCQFIENMTLNGKKTYTNFSISGTSAQCSNKYTISLIRGNVINFTVIANDTSNNLKMNDTIITVANSPPSFTILGGAKEKEPYNSSLAGYWDMDDWNATYVMDKTSNNNDGLIFGANRSNGKLGYGMVFDGVNDYVEAPDSDSLNPSEITMEAWVYPKKKHDSYERIFEKAAPLSYSFLSLAAGSDGVLSTFQGKIGGTSYTISGNTGVPQNVWSYLVITYKDGEGIKFYVNGVLDKTNTTPTGSIGTDTANLVIGASTGFAALFDGTIDEVKIYNRALSADEIANHYSQGIGKGNITTQTPLAVSVNASSDADNDILYTAVDWYKNGILNATTGNPNHNNSVLFMPFDARSTTGITEDYSVMNNDGTISGAVFTNDSAVGLGSLQFDGSNDYVNAGNGASLQISQDVTWEAWIYPNVVLARQDFIAKVTSGAARFLILRTHTDGKLYLSVTTASQSKDTISVSTLSTGRWYHVVGTYNGANTRIYINGVLDKEDTTTGLLNLNTGNLTIGYNQYDNQFYFNGTIDEVKIYNNSLSASEIRQHYQASKLKGLILNHSETKKNEKWNATVTLYDPTATSTTPINFTFDIIGNTIPNATYITNTTGLLRKTNQTFNLSYAYDPDKEDGIDTINYVVYWGTTSSPVNLFYNGTQNNITTNFTSDNTYYFQVKSMDGSSESALSSVFNITLDTSNPTDNLLTIVPNLTYVRINTTYTIQASDSNLEGHNLTIFFGDEIGGNLQFSKEITNIAGTTNSFSFTANISWSDGRYTIVSNESDDHNEPSIEKALKRLRGLNFYHPNTGDKDYDDNFVRLVFNRTINGKIQNISIWVGYLDAQNNPQKLTKTQANNYEVSRLTYIGAEGYEFGGLFKLPNTNFKFGFALEKNDLILRNLETAHFKWGREHYIDFDAEINGTPINPKLKETADFYGIYYLVDWAALGFKNNDVINFTTKSIGGVNLGSSRTQLEIDTGIPQFFDLNLSSTEIKPNNTFISAKILNFTFNVSDKNNNTILFYVNGNKNITTGYISNQTKNATITFDEGNYSILMEINDSAGNKLNSSFINVAVDTVLPIFTEAVNRTTANSTNILDNTDVNLSVFGMGDIYLKNGNISHNASGSWINHSAFDEGNNTYHLIINKNNLTSGQVVGWKFYAYDLAGNELDPIYTFIVGSSATSIAVISSIGGGGGGGGTLSRCAPFADAFGVCYWHNGYSCVKGCPEGLVCNTDFRCITNEMEAEQEEIKQLSFLQRLWLWTKNGFNNFWAFTKSGLDSSSSLSIEQQETAVIKAEERTQVVQATKEAMLQVPEQIKQHPYMALSIAGIVAVILAFIQFNIALFMPPLIFYIIAYYFIVWVLWFFRVLQ